MRQISRTTPQGEFLLEGKKFINLTSWDIFGLRDNPIIKKAVHKAIEADSRHRNSPRIVAGVAPEVREVELKIAKIYQMDDSILFTSRNQAIFTLVTNLLTENDVVIYGDGVDAPIVDACFLSGTQVLAFNYNKPSTLEDALKKSKEVEKRPIIFLEDFNPYLPFVYDVESLLKVAADFGVSVIYDDSYSFSLVQGYSKIRMKPELLKVNFHSIINRLDSYLGSLGACITTSFDFSGKILNNSRYLRKEQTYPTVNAIHILNAFELLFSDLEIKSKVLRIRDELSRRLVDLSPSLLVNTETNFLSLTFDNYSIGMELKNLLLSKGFLIEVFKSQVLKDSSCVVPLLLPDSFSLVQLSDFADVFIADKVKVE